MPNTPAFRFLRRKQIDEEAWDARVLATPRTPIYNLSWYLDAATNGQWSAVVVDDYEYLLPLPFNRKWFGLPRVVMPPLCQQIGVLTENSDQGANEVSERVAARVQKMLEEIPSRYLRTHLQLRMPQRVGKDLKLTPRSNLILDLLPGYDHLHTNYGKSLRKRLRRTQGYYRLEASQDIAALLGMYRHEVGARVGIKAAAYRRIEAIIQDSLARGYGKIWQVIHTDGSVHARGFFAGRTRVINLFGASSAAGRAGFAMHFLLDRVIELACEEEAGVFDFEGSEIEGVRQFFLSFGASEEHYWVYRQQNI